MGTQADYSPEDWAKLMKAKRMWEEYEREEAEAARKTKKKARFSVPYLRLVSSNGRSV